MHSYALGLFFLQKNKSMDSQKRDSMVIYRSFYEAIKDLPEKDQAIIWKAVFEFGLNFNEIDLAGLPSMVFKLIKPQLIANLKKYQNGLKGGVKKGTKTEPKQNLNETKTEPKQNQNQIKREANENENDNVNDNENVFIKKKLSIEDQTNQHNQYFQNIWAQKIWVESVCMQFKKEKHEVKAHLNRFRLECIGKEEFKESEKDAKNHFINWVKKGNEIPREYKPSPFGHNDF